MNRRKKPFSDENLHILMKKLYSTIMDISNNVVKIIVSPPKHIRISLVKLNKKIKRLFKFSISFKITALSTFKIFRRFLGTSIFLLLAFVAFNLYNLNETFESNNRYISGYISESNSVSSGDIESIITNYSVSESLKTLIFKEDSAILDTSIAHVPSELESSDESSGDIKSSLCRSLYDSQNISISNISLGLSSSSDKSYYITYTHTMKIRDVNYIIFLIKPFSTIYENINVLIVLLLFIFVIDLYSCSKYISKLTKSMMSPVYIMNDTIKEINVNNLDMRLNVHGSQDELKDLSITVNEMFDRIEESYDKQKQFVSDASHELRTPISVIQGYANLLSRWGKDDKEVLEESILAIKDESENMKGLIEKLLFLARADKSTQKVEKSEFNLSHLLENLCKETKMIDTEHAVSYDVSENLIVFADEKLIKQALRILMDNATKYTPSGGDIQVSAYSSGNDVFLKVSDSGVGIPKEDIPHIFDRFYRVDESRSKTSGSGGTGLGLSIAKWIAEIHTGSISVESSVNKGSVFTIKIPFKA